MLKINNWKRYFWIFIVLLLIVPVTNSLFVNLKKITSVLSDYSRHKFLLNALEMQNERLSNKLKFYKTEHGMKTLIKERLNKVEEGELIIRFRDNNLTLTNE